MTIIALDRGGNGPRIEQELREDIKSLEDEIGENELEISKLRERKDLGPLEDAVNAALDLVERPVGTLRPFLPQSPASERALIALYDAIGRIL